VDGHAFDAVVITQAHLFNSLATAISKNKNVVFSQARLPPPLPLARQCGARAADSRRRERLLHRADGAGHPHHHRRRVRPARRRADPGAIRQGPRASELFPLGDAIEAQPWMGARPCFADSRPVIGRAPGRPGLWLAYGHGHSGLTLGPVTGRLLADMMTGATPFCDPVPYRAERFAQPGSGCLLPILPFDGVILCQKGDR
jgi:glycine/D-amino acid oxidase-like deaminating enzyme